VVWFSFDLPSKPLLDSLSSLLFSVSLSAIAVLVLTFSSSPLALPEPATAAAISSANSFASTSFSSAANLVSSQ
jgi:hypothetical protein